jgi:hypothetical protein
MTPDEILDAVSRVEAAGASVQLSDGRPKLFGNVEAVPDDARRTLRGRSAELVAYLTTSARPAPVFVRFVSKRLEVVELPAGVVEGVSVFWRDDRPFYRLAPAVLAWAETQTSKLTDRPDVLALVGDLGKYVAAHYPPHQIRAARLRRAPLPEVKPPPTCPGADAWKRLPWHNNYGGGNEGV